MVLTKCLYGPAIAVGPLACAGVITMCGHLLPITISITATKHVPSFTVQADPMVSVDVLDMHISHATKGYRETLISEQAVIGAAVEVEQG